jgi:hypothetical protein
MNYRKYSNKCRLNNLYLSDQWVIEEVKENQKKILESNEDEKSLSEFRTAMLKRKVYLYQCLP